MTPAGTHIRLGIFLHASHQIIPLTLWVLCAETAGSTECAMTEGACDVDRDMHHETQHQLSGDDSGIHG